MRARARSGRVTQRCHNSPRWKMGLASANNVTHRKRAEDFCRVETSLGRRRLAFASSRGFVAGAAWDGGGADEKARIERMCISLPYVETFTSKVIKGFVPELGSRYVFFEFFDSFVLSVWTFDVRFTHSHIWLWYTGCSHEDLPKAMDDREEWRERVRDIPADGATRWWWWWWQLCKK